MDDPTQHDDPTTLNSLDKRLALLELTMTNGFEVLRRELERLTAMLTEGLGKSNDRLCKVENRLDDIEPFVRSAQNTWAIAWKILVGVGVAGILWAIAQSGALVP
jgi:hypothetical protein